MFIYWPGNKNTYLALDQKAFFRWGGGEWQNILEQWIFGVKKYDYVDIWEKLALDPSAFFLGGEGQNTLGQTISISTSTLCLLNNMKKKLVLSTYIFRARPGAEYFSANNININVEQYGKKTCPGPAFFRARGGTIFQPEKTQIFYHEKKNISTIWCDMAVG